MTQGAGGKPRFKKVETEEGSPGVKGGRGCTDEKIGRKCGNTPFLEQRSSGWPIVKTERV